jgi:prophage regulatory protein
MSEAILRLPQVKSRVGLSRSSIYVAISQGKFPRPVRLSALAGCGKRRLLGDWKGRTFSRAVIGPLVCHSEVAPAAEESACQTFSATC